MTGRAMGSHQRKAGAKDEWLTPVHIIRALGEFDLDPCAPVTRPWDMAKRHYTIEDNGLILPWAGRVWLNAPYKTASAWMRKMAAHGVGTALLFARLETQAFFDFVWGQASALFFFEGRLTFHHVSGRPGAYNGGAPSVLIAYGNDDADRLAEAGFNGAFVPLACKGQIIAVLRGPDDVDMTWRELIEEQVRRAGGKATIELAYTLVSRHPKSAANNNLRAKVRQILQGASFRRVAPGNYELAI